MTLLFLDVSLFFSLPLLILGQDRNYIHVVGVKSHDTPFKSSNYSVDLVSLSSYKT